MRHEGGGNAPGLLSRCDAGDKQVQRLDFEGGRVYAFLEPRSRSFEKEVDAAIVIVLRGRTIFTHPSPARTIGPGTKDENNTKSYFIISPT